MKKIIKLLSLLSIATTPVVIASSCGDKINPNAEIEKYNKAFDEGEKKGTNPHLMSDMGGTAFERADLTINLNNYNNLEELWTPYRETLHDLWGIFIHNEDDWIKKNGKYFTAHLFIHFQYNGNDCKSLVFEQNFGGVNRGSDQGAWEKETFMSGRIFDNNSHLEEDGIPSCEENYNNWGSRELI